MPIHDASRAESASAGVVPGSRPTLVGTDPSRDLIDMASGTQNEIYGLDLTGAMSNGVYGLNMARAIVRESDVEAPLADGVLAKAEQVFAAAVRREAFGNARFVRSLFEQAYTRMAARAAADGNAPSMSRNRCTVPPSSSPEANTGSFDRAATAATSAVTSPVWAPTSA